MRQREKTRSKKWKDKVDFFFLQSGQDGKIKEMKGRKQMRNQPVDDTGIVKVKMTVNVEGILKKTRAKETQLLFQSQRYMQHGKL